MGRELGVLGCPQEMREQPSRCFGVPRRGLALERRGLGEQEGSGGCVLEVFQWGRGAAVAVSARCHNGQEGRGGCVPPVPQWGRDTAAQLG